MASQASSSASTCLACANSSSLRPTASPFAMALLTKQGLPHPAVKSNDCQLPQAQEQLLRLLGSRDATASLSLFLAAS